MRKHLESTLHACISSCTGTIVSSSEVVASVVSTQLQSEAQFSSSTLVVSAVSFEPLMLKIDDHS